jgi:hypothetical protein
MAENLPFKGVAMNFLRKHAEGATEGDPDYWYGVIESTGGNLWGQLCYSEHEATKLADELGGGMVVIVACRVLEDDEGDHWPLPVRTEKMELAEAEQAVEQSRKVFEETMQRSTIRSK